MADARNRTVLDRPAMQEQIERARDRIDDLDTRLRRVMRDQPLVAVASAVVLGYALARLFARR
jgi:hypothetical protein